MWTITKTLNLALICGLLIPLVGCQTYGPTDLTPAREVLNAACCQPDTEEQINFLKLRRTPPQEYVLDGGDTLGIYIQGITGDKDIPPPVHFPDEGGQPALGYPVPIRDDGYISLPLVAPVRVTGLTIGEAEAKIVRAYTKDKKILLEGSEKIIVTLMKPRSYNVLVIREDVVGSSQTALKKRVDCQLSEPRMKLSFDQANIVRIPIKAERGAFPQLSEADITLEDGDVVYIKGRERDVFFTGGLLEGGRFPLPRDYQIDVLEAIALAGGASAATAGASGGALSRLGSVKPATQVTVLRRCGCEQVAIDVDLRFTLSEPSERVIIQPGDLIILEYRKNELFINSFASIFRI